MPEISRFYGIAIFMNFNDHAPALFHVWYGKYKATIEISTGVVTGKMPVRTLRMVSEWLDLHREELLCNWNKAKCGEKLGKIEPLK